MFAGYAPPPMAPGIVDVGREAPRTYIAMRGNPDAPGEEVRPGFLTVLGGGEIPDPPLHVKTTGRRKALAEWMASAENPLFARVMVNRIWQYHFGSGLVKTSERFRHPRRQALASRACSTGWRRSSSRASGRSRRCTS